MRVRNSTQGISTFTYLRLFWLSELSFSYIGVSHIRLMHNAWFLKFHILFRDRCKSMRQLRVCFAVVERAMPFWATLPSKNANWHLATHNFVQLSCSVIVPRFTIVKAVKEGYSTKKPHHRLSFYSSQKNIQANKNTPATRKLKQVFWPNNLRHQRNFLPTPTP